MSVARDISRQTSRQTVTLTASQTAVTVTGGFTSSTVEVYLNGVKLVQGQDYSLNGTSGITLSQGASAGDIIEFAIRNSSNSGFSAADTGQIVDGAITEDKLSDSSTETENVQRRIAAAWVNFQGNVDPAVIRDSYNVSSVTDNGATGLWYVNFSRNMANGNYCTQVTQHHATAITWNVGPSVSTSDVSYVRVSASRDGGSLYNSEIMCVTVFGELS